MSTLDIVLDRLSGTNDQMREFLHEQQIAQARDMERVRGVKPLRQPVIPQVAAAATLQCGGPEQGFMWDVRAITGTLSANDSVAAYVGDTATGNNRLLGYAGPPGAAPAQLKFVINPAAHSAILYPGEQIFLATSGAGNITMAMLAGVEVIAERIGEYLA